MRPIWGMGGDFFCAIFHFTLVFNFMGIRRTCGHAITPCDSLSALLTVPYAAQLITRIARCSRP